MESLQNKYIRRHSTPQGEALDWIERQTNVHTNFPQMLSGSVQGAFLRMLCSSLSARRVLEIGTFTGYSALCLADGLQKDGELHTIENNIEFEDRIRQYVGQSPLCDQIILHIGDAKSVIPSLDYSWDLAFIDAEKEDYQDYYDLILPRVRKGGFLLVDNTLWNGKVTQQVAHNDRDTQAILAFNDFVQNDSRVRNLLLPFRDGIMMIEKL